MKKQKTPNIVFLAVMTTITAIFWAFFGAYRVFTTKPETAVSPEIIEPVDPKLDSSIIDKMQNSVFFEEGEVTSSISSPSPTPTETPIPSASPESSEISTASGTVSQ